MKLVKVIILSIIVIVVGLTAMAQNKKVAIFDPVGAVQSSAKEIVREEMSAIVVNINGYTVLERSLINKVLEENQFQAGGLVDDSQISEMGKMMGANYVLVTTLTLMETGNYYISCKMIDVLTARIEKQKTTQTFKGVNDLRPALQKMMGEMFNIQVTVSPDDDSHTQKGTSTSEPATPKALPDIPLGCGIIVMGTDIQSNTQAGAKKECERLGYRLPTPEEMECMCKVKRTLNLFGKAYLTSETSSAGRVIVFTSNDCEKEKRNTDNKYSCRCVKNAY